MEQTEESVEELQESMDTMEELQEIEEGSGKMPSPEDQAIVSDQDLPADKYRSIDYRV